MALGLTPWVVQSLKEDERIRWCFTHRTSINNKEDKACGRFCMEYSAINVIECRIHADAPDIYIADVWIGGSGNILNVVFAVIARTSNKNRTTNIVVNLMT